MCPRLAYTGGQLKHDKCKDPSDTKQCTAKYKTLITTKYGSYAVEIMTDYFTFIFLDYFSIRSLPESVKCGSI